MGGGTDADENIVEKPSELAWAQMIDSICQRYGALPSAVLAEDVDLLRILALVSAGEDKK